MVESGGIPEDFLAQIELRKKEAIDKDFLGKVKMICETVGYRETGSGYIPQSGLGGDYTYTYLKRSVKSMGLGVEFSERIFDDKSGARGARIYQTGIFIPTTVLEIECDVKPGEKDVIDVKRYVPGNWEKKFDDLITTANKIAATRKQEEINLMNADREDKVQDLKDRFGL